MRLIDTPVWVEWLIDSVLGKAIAGKLPAREQWLVQTIVTLLLFGHSRPNFCGWPARSGIKVIKHHTLRVGFSR